MTLCFMKGTSVETKKMQAKIPMELYNKIVKICKADKRSINIGLQILLQEVADNYEVKQAKLLKVK